MNSLLTSEPPLVDINRLFSFSQILCGVRASNYTALIWTCWQSTTREKVAQKWAKNYGFQKGEPVLPPYFFVYFAERCLRFWTLSTRPIWTQKLKCFKIGADKMESCEIRTHTSHLKLPGGRESSKQFSRLALNFWAAVRISRWHLLSQSYFDGFSKGRKAA